jgi:4-hydroxybenzoate polyprenyltransferase
LTGTVPPLVLVVAAAMAAYVAGLTYAAWQESLDRVGSLWPLLLLAAPLGVAIVALSHTPGALAVLLGLAGWTAAAVYLLARRPIAGAVPRAVGWLIAGISLVDAAMLAGVAATVPALLAIAGFAATLAAQKYVAGT